MKKITGNWYKWKWTRIVPQYKNNYWLEASVDNKTVVMHTKDSHKRLDRHVTVTSEMNIFLCIN